MGGCPGWSESSLDAHAILLVLSWGCSHVALMIMQLSYCQFSVRIPKIISLYSVPFGAYLGPKFGPIPNAKNVSFISNWWGKFPSLKILKKSDWKFLKEALKTVHFLNVFRHRIRSECFPKRLNSNLTKWMFGDRYRRLSLSQSPGDQTKYFRVINSLR